MFIDSTKFAKKTTFGGYKEVSGGESDPECTHVIMTRDEYHRLLKEIRQAQQETRDIRISADNAVADIKRDANYRIQQAETEAQKSISSLKQELSAEQAESEYQRQLNVNLLRISKERANADRKLRPKKEHSGYVVVSSIEKEYRYRDHYRGTQTVTLWETTVQSPYSVDFTEEQAREQMKEMARSDENGESLMRKIGIEYCYGDAYEKMLKDQGWKNHEGYNIMLDSRMKANFRTGYWETIFLHTLPLDVVPKDMRAE